jgi:hypothetical protein
MVIIKTSRCRVLIGKVNLDLFILLKNVLEKITFFKKSTDFLPRVELL